MSVHYKFKNSLDFSTVTFDGIHISVGDLKKEIADQKHLKQNADFELLLSNAETQEVYEDDLALIPKNTAVIVARIPVTSRRNVSNGPGGSGFHQRQHHNKNMQANVMPSAVSKGVDLASMDGSEEDKIKAMISQSTAGYDPSNYQRIRGSGQHGKVPLTYRCNKCLNTGHWIKDCPLQPDHAEPAMKKSTGIPRSFMVHVDGPNVPGALMTPEGRYAVPAVDLAAYMDKHKAVAKPPSPKPKIPDELVCALCDDLMTDALMVPCCANSYCDDCIRKALCESDEQECPGCHEKDISPTSLIPNRFLRSTVNTFKNETGYSKPEPGIEVKRDSSVITVDLTDKREEGSTRKLSLDELPEDLFPHSPRKIDPSESDSDVKKETSADDEEKPDLYDFNDSSIPSPFSSPRRVESAGESTEHTIKTIGTGYYAGPKPSFTQQPPSHTGRHQSSNQAGSHTQQHHHRPLKEHYRPQRNAPTPMQSNLPSMPSMPPPHLAPPTRRVEVADSAPFQDQPPPPGFQDILPLPPGEDRVPTPTNRSREGNAHRMDDQGHFRERPQDRELGGMDGMQKGSLLPLPGIPPFNPSQPPPGFGGPNTSMPQPGKGPPGQMAPQMYPGPMPPGMPPQINMPPQGQNYPPTFHNNYRLPPPGNGGPPPVFHPGNPPPMRGMAPRDREREMQFVPRDRSIRKSMISEGRPRDREHSEEIRPGPIDDPLKEFERLMREKDRRKKMLGKRSRSRPYSPARRSPSPFAKRSRSRSYSRSPSPRRKRPRVFRRRKSYSRTPSRSPTRRNLRSRYDAIGSRYYGISNPGGGSNNGKPYHERPRDYTEPSSKYENPSKYSDQFEGNSKYEVGILTGPSITKKFDHRNSGNRDRDGNHHQGNSANTSTVSDTNIGPPGAEKHKPGGNLDAVPPSLFELNISPPMSYPVKPNLTPVNTHHSTYHHQDPSSHSESGQLKDKRSHDPPDKADFITGEFESVSVMPENEIDAAHKKLKRRHRRNSHEDTSEKVDKKKDHQDSRSHPGSGQLKDKRSHDPPDKGDLIAGEFESTSVMPDNEIDAANKKLKRRYRKNSHEDTSEKVDKKKEHQDTRSHPESGQLKDKKSHDPPDKADLITDEFENVGVMLDNEIDTAHKKLKRRHRRNSHEDAIEKVDQKKDHQDPSSHPVSGQLKDKKLQGPPDKVDSITGESENLSEMPNNEIDIANKKKKRRHRKKSHEDSSERADRKKEKKEKKKHKKKKEKDDKKVKKSKKGKPSHRQDKGAGRY